MKYKDRVYSEVEITEPVILELINSPSLQRLKGINQYGYPSFAPLKTTVRFEHSLGVFILLKKYSASLEEQIVGLIHDVSHSAFSHSIDYVLDGGSEKEQNHQDNIFHKFIKNSKIPEILTKYNLNLEYVLDESNFPLKEKKLPDLCADRIDYSLRDGFALKEVSHEQIGYFLDNLIVENNSWIFKNFESAKSYAKFFDKMNKKHYSDINSAAMFATLSSYLKYALQKDYITERDFYTTDREVLVKIAKNLDIDKKLELLYERMHDKIGFKNNPKDYDIHTFCKSRVVDPLCFHDGKIQRVSHIDPSWSKIVVRESKPKEYFIKFLRRDYERFI